MVDPGFLATLGGVLALVGGTIGSVIGITKAASAGTATLSEDPGQFRSVIVLASMPMTQTFYGLIVMILIITAVVPKLPATGGGGLIVLGWGVFAALAEFFSAIYQGIVCASGVSLLPKTKGGVFVPSMMLAVFVELLGVLGLVFTIMALTISGLM
jgi:V/A-type H+-transporting ATPase subunit K